MSFFAFVKIIHQRFVSIIIITAAVAVLSALITRVLPEKFDSSVSLNILRVNREETPDYQYDGFYAIQASDLFAQTVISWLQTPSVVNEIYGQSGVDSKFTSLSSFSGRFSAKKMSSQNIVIHFAAKSKEESDKLSSALISVVGQKAQDSLKTTKNIQVFDVKASNPITVKREYNIVVALIAGIASGLVLGILWALGKNYFKEESVK